MRSTSTPPPSAGDHQGRSVGTAPGRRSTQFVGGGAAGAAAGCRTRGPVDASAQIVVNRRHDDDLRSRSQWTRRSVQSPTRPDARATDFVGIASTAPRPRTAQPGARDPLPDEPGGYTGYKALFGAKYVNPAITGGQAAVNDINGNSDHRRARPARLPGLRRHARRDHARLRGPDAGGRHPGHVRLHLRRARQPRRRRRVRTRRERLRRRAEELRRRVREVLRPAGGRRHQQEQHAVRRHRRRERPLRRTAGPELRRRPRRVHVQHHAGGRDRREARSTASST